MTTDPQGEGRGEMPFSEFALRLIAKGGCENYTFGTCEDAGKGRRPDAECTADRYCNPRIARCGLRGGF